MHKNGPVVALPECQQCRQNIIYKKEYDFPFIKYHLQKKYHLPFSNMVTEEEEEPIVWKGSGRRPTPGQEEPQRSTQACSPLIQLFFGFVSDIDQTNISRDIRDGNWLSTDTAIIPNAVIECFWNIDTARNFGSDWYFICMLIRSVFWPIRHKIGPLDRNSVEF